MPSIEIPFPFINGLPPHLNGLIKLYSLPDIDTLVSNLKEAKISINPEKSIRDVVASTTGFTPDEVYDLSRGIMRLLIIQSNSDNSPSDLIDELFSDIPDSEIEKLNLTEDKHNEIKKRVVEILNSENLLISVKAVGIKFEQDNLFERARIITQILPIFSDDISQTPKVAMIIHQLGIHYFQDGEHKEFFLRIDEEEIDDLMKILERAKIKGNSLQKFLGTTEVQYIENI